MRREELEISQFERLKKNIEWAYDKSKFYRQSFQRAGVTPDDLKTADDIKKFPFLTLTELNREDSMDFLTLPLSSIVRINYLEDSDAGINVANFYTKDDIVKNVEMMTHCLHAAKIYRGASVGVQGDLSDSKFLDVIYALESMNITVVPLSNNYRQCINILDTFALDTLISTSSRRQKYCRLSNKKDYLSEHEQYSKPFAESHRRTYKFGSL